MVKCQDCGASISNNAKFCPKCGSDGIAATGNSLINKIFIVGFMCLGTYFFILPNGNFLTAIFYYSGYTEAIRLTGIGMVLFSLYTFIKK